MCKEVAKGKKYRVLRESLQWWKLLICWQTSLYDPFSLYIFRGKKAPHSLEKVWLSKKICKYSQQQTVRFPPSDNFQDRMRDRVGTSDFDKIS
jgi:hypothetical protein